MEYKVSDTDLTSVANAIRTKGGTNAPLSFPTDFIDAIGDINTSGLATLITKSISANGVYEASDDNANGYSEVSVNVPSKHVRGTFTGTASGAMNVSIPYTGNGYPILAIINPTGGAYNSDTEFYQTVQKFAICSFVLIKNDFGSTPDYSTYGTPENAGSVLVRYKSSDSDATAYAAGNESIAAEMHTTRAASNTSTSCARFVGAKMLSVYIADTSYGFMRDIEYTYDIVYSE